MRPVSVTNWTFTRPLTVCVGATPVTRIMSWVTDVGQFEYVLGVISVGIGASSGAAAAPSRTGPASAVALATLLTSRTITNVAAMRNPLSRIGHPLPEAVRC